MGIKFGIAHKLFAVCLAFGLPIVVMLVLMTKAKLTDIDFASQELVGDGFQRPLEEVMQHVGRHRRLWARRQHGDGSLVGALAAEERAIRTALLRVAVADRDHGAKLQFTPEGLGLRKRDEFTATGLREKWQHLSAALPTLPVGDEQAGYRGVLTHVRAMITHAGDASNLILDPDLDSYYLMDVTLLALPQMEARLQQLAVDVDELAFRDRLTTNDKVEIAKGAAFLEEADWERIAASSATALNEDRNFHGVCSTLAPRVEAHLVAGSHASRRVVERMRTLAGLRSFAGFDLPAFRADLEALDAELYAFHREAFDQEDALLGIRIADFRASLYRGFILAGLSVLLSSVLAFMLASNVVRRVKRISRATDAFARGEMDARSGATGSDEIGDLARSFDSMTDRIGALTTNLEKIVEERTAQLGHRNAEFKLILDNAHDGMLTVELDGSMSSERSARVGRWFGTPEARATLPEYLGRDNPILAAELQLGLDELRCDSMPLSVTLDQLPRRMDSGGRHFRLTYQPILAQEAVRRLLVIISDVTDELEAQRAVGQQQETLRIFQACQRDRAGFLDFFAEARDLVERISAIGGHPSGGLRRAVHTLKGNSALFGALSLSALCHELETNMAEAGGVLVASDLLRLEHAWAELATTAREILGERAERKLEVADEEYSSIVEAIARGAPRAEILTAIAQWKLEPADRRMVRAAEQARTIARRLGKDIEVELEPSSNVRLCPASWTPFWSAFGHVVRNAVDHGIEAGEERVRKGKLARGRLTLRTELAGGLLLIEARDDGRGVDWDVVAKRARGRQLPSATRADLVEALFTDGLSTKEQVTDTSGRGVGMSAVREACRILGGRVDVESEPGLGTTIRCCFPASAMGGQTFAGVADLAVRNTQAPPAEVA
jgi:HPt (histidine-containing phosphotransfer) domain-containing protein/HAMP domain-containing protein/two-component sensor histidine kinase